MGNKSSVVTKFKGAMKRNPKSKSIDDFNESYE